MTQYDPAIEPQAHDAIRTKPSLAAPVPLSKALGISYYTATWVLEVLQYRDGVPCRYVFDHRSVENTEISYAIHGVQVDASGFRAGRIGVPENANPYPSDHWAYQVWRDGRQRAIDSDQPDHTYLTLPL
ncbi:hypothetical protein AWH63_10805 [Marinobacter sp. C18]|uniref:hypothetical protein n=1 Tax=Marinobacter sp. C18 TaxID=1772288 RepID=UPI000948A95F|nr:hypothetical protein [Marinobacter sp. C18]OLF82020.1 hypothetical protein AWH63_10805 [Marinobacter sp. C18]